MTNACTCNRCRYAGFWRRVLAHLVDVVALLVFLYALAMVAVVVLTAMTIWVGAAATTKVSWDFSASKDVDTAVELAAYLFFMALWLLSRAAFESSPLQGTVGKLALSIKVTDVAGRRISFLRALVRNFATLISDATFLIGYLMVAFTPRKRALHDMVAGCLVVKHDDVQTCTHADRGPVVPAHA
jgi:uncharacterized RDD family membrane protein YckC